MKHTITTDIEIFDGKLLETIYQSVKVEMRASEIKRGKVEVIKENSKLIIITHGKDLTSTRGLTNSIMRLIKTSVDVTDAINFKLD